MAPLEPFSRGMILLSSGIGLTNEAVDDDARADRETELRSLYERVLGGVFRDIQNVGRQKTNIFGFKLHDFLQIDFYLALLAAGILTHDDSMVRLGGAVEAAGQGEELEGSELAAVVGNRKTTRPGDCAAGIHNARVRYGNDITGHQNNIVRNVSGLENFIPVHGHGLGQLRPARSRASALPS